jgi:hypothetical protein
MTALELNWDSHFPPPKYDVLQSCLHSKLNHHIQTHAAFLDANV